MRVVRWSLTRKGALKITWREWVRPRIAHYSVGSAVGATAGSRIIGGLLWRSECAGAICI